MPRGRPAKAKAEEKPAERKEASAEVDENVKLAPKRGRGRPPKDKTGSHSDEKPAEEKEALAEVDENVKLAPKRGRGRPPKDKTGSHSDEKPAEEKEALAEVDENTEDAKPVPKRGRGRPPKDKTGTKSGGVENMEHSEVGEEPAVKKAKKKPHTSQNVKKISIEFCKS